MATNTSHTNYATAERRWAGLGPYYAMFPITFADRVIRSYTEVGDTVLDPFAGRGTAVFSAATQGRSAIGVEVSPVGFVYAKTKLSPADHDQVVDRVRKLGQRSDRRQYRERAHALPPFFKRCFSLRVRRFLLAARDELDWRRSTIDRTTMAILLVHLHGKLGSALSNQMRQTKSLSPDYALRWWKDRDLFPPDIDPIAFLESRLEWRYAKGIPRCDSSRVYLGNSLQVLPRLAQKIAKGRDGKVKLLFTSPPYHSVTNYHYDQWLRLWALGGRSDALLSGNGIGGKFEHRERYRALLADVFTRARETLHRDATVYVRTDSREFTRDTTIEMLMKVFPRKQLAVRRRPVNGATQTELFGGVVRRSAETDIILTPK